MNRQQMIDNLKRCYRAHDAACTHGKPKNHEHAIFEENCTCGALRANDRLKAVIDELAKT